MHNVANAEAPEPRIAAVDKHEVPQARAAAQGLQNLHKFVVGESGGEVTRAANGVGRGVGGKGIEKVLERVRAGFEVGKLDDAAQFELGGWWVVEEQGHEILARQDGRKIVTTGRHCPATTHLSELLCCQLGLFQ